MKNKRMDHISKIMSKRHDDFTENFTTLKTLPTFFLQTRTFNIF